MAKLTKETHAKPTLISTGLKCCLSKDEYLKIVVRSSTPLKYWLILANSEGVIDSDYYNNADNEGEIYIQIINLSPFDLKIKKGETIAQGLIMPVNHAKCAIKSEERIGGFGSTSNS